MGQEQENSNKMLLLFFFKSCDINIFLTELVLLLYALFKNYLSEVTFQTPVFLSISPIMPVN